MIGLLASADTALVLGLCFAGAALGLVVSLRFLNFPDLTLEGSVPLGAAVGAQVMLRTRSFALAALAAIAAGMLAGVTTAALHVFLRVGRLLSGILMVAVLYTVGLRVIGGSNVSLLQAQSVWQRVEAHDRAWSDRVGTAFDPMKLAFLVALMGTLAVALVAFFKSRPGLTIRALGDNEQLVAGLGRDPRPYTFLGLALSNGLAGLSGALIAFNQGFADVGMGQGALVVGLAGVILGEQSIGRIVGTRRVVAALVAAALVGSVLYQATLLAGFSMGVQASDVKLVTAVLVLMVVVLTGGGSFFYKGRTF